MNISGPDGNGIASRGEVQIYSNSIKTSGSAGNGITFEAGSIFKVIGNEIIRTASAIDRDGFAIFIGHSSTSKGVSDNKVCREGAADWASGLGIYGIYDHDAILADKWIIPVQKQLGGLCF